MVQFIGKSQSCGHNEYISGEVWDAWRQDNTMYVVVRYKCSLCEAHWRETHIKTFPNKEINQPPGGKE